jgi:hypothetical protein
MAWFHSRNHRNNSKERANSPFLHASYTFCMTKEHLPGGGNAVQTQILYREQDAYFIYCW